MVSIGFPVNDLILSPDIIVSFSLVPKLYLPSKYTVQVVRLQTLMVSIQMKFTN